MRVEKRSSEKSEQAEREKRQQRDRSSAVLRERVCSSSAGSRQAAVRAEASRCSRSMRAVKTVAESRKENEEREALPERKRQAVKSVRAQRLQKVRRGTPPPREEKTRCSEKEYMQRNRQQRKRVQCIQNKREKSIWQQSSDMYAHSIYAKNLCGSRYMLYRRVCLYKTHMLLFMVINGVLHRTSRRCKNGAQSIALWQYSMLLCSRNAERSR